MKIYVNSDVVLSTRSLNMNIPFLVCCCGNRSLKRQFLLKCKTVSRVDRKTMVTQTYF